MDALNDLARRRLWATEELAKRAFTHRLTRYLSSDGERGAAARVYLEFHKTQTKGRVVCGGNRSAKSTAAAIEGYWWATGTHPFRSTPKPPTYGRVLVPDLPLSFADPHAQLDLIKDWYPLHVLRGGSWETAYSVRGCTLHFTNGSMIEFISTAQDAATQAGTSHLAWLWVDEECGKEHLRENQLRLDRAGSGWWLTYAPIGREPWLYDDIFLPASKGKLTDVTLLQVSMLDNLHNLDPAYVRQIMASLSPADIERRVHGHYAQHEGLVFDTPIEACDAEAILRGAEWVATDEE